LSHENDFGSNLTKRTTKGGIEKMYRIVTEIDDYKPRIWRRILVYGDTSVTDFAYGIMSIYNAEGTHLWNVESIGQKTPRHRLTWANSKTYMYVSEDTMDIEDYQNPDTHTVSDLFKEKGDIVLVNYDFGDGWCFKCVLEEIYENNGTERPCVLRWKGHGIVDDCGGIMGLDEALDETDEDFEPWTIERLNRALKLQDCPYPEFYAEIKEESDRIYANIDDYRTPGGSKKEFLNSLEDMIKTFNQSLIVTGKKNAKPAKERNVKLTVIKPVKIEEPVKKQQKKATEKTKKK
jgi:hypothetical protein